MRFFFLILASVASSASSISITCNINNASLYTLGMESFECEIENDLKITQRNSLISSISGSLNLTEAEYEDSLENSTAILDISDVQITTLITYNNTINFLPSNLHEFFPNLTLLAVVKSNLLELHQSELKSLTELQALWLPFNKITVIEWRLFDFNTKLHELILTENRIKVVYTDAFLRLQRLEHLDLLANECVNGLAATEDDVAVLLGQVEELCKYDCGCENYFLIAICILSLFCMYVVLYVIFR